MNRQQRYEILSHLRSTAQFDQYGVTYQNPLLKGDEALYAIPEHIVDAISNSQLKLMSADEIELEKFFAGFCRRVAIVGFAVSGGVRFPLLQPIESGSDCWSLREV